MSAPRSMRRMLLAACAIVASLPGDAWSAGCSGDGATGGILGLDRCEEFEATGIWSRRNQQALDTAVIATTVGTALWLGTDTPVGRTAWQSLDGMITTAAATEVMKRVFQRPRPSQIADPDLWRQGGRYKSFPSGETAMMAAAVTPVIADWQAGQPAVWALAALPLYMAKARMGSQAHWASDVLAGAGVGIAGGLLAARRAQPLVLLPLNGGVFVGWHTRF